MKGFVKASDALPDVFTCEVILTRCDSKTPPKGIVRCHEERRLANYSVSSALHIPATKAMCCTEFSLSTLSQRKVDLFELMSALQWPEALYTGFRDLAIDHAQALERAVLKVGPREKKTLDFHKEQNAALRQVLQRALNYRKYNGQPHWKLRPVN